MPQPVQEAAPPPGGRSGRVQWVLLCLMVVLAGLPILVFRMAGADLRTILDAARSDSSWDSYHAVNAGEGSLQGPAGKLLDDCLAEFERRGKELSIGYRAPDQLVYLTRAISPCHGMRAVSGPFYCGDDERLYLEQAFFDELEAPFGAKSQLAQAYMIGFLVSQHLQTRMGLRDKLQESESMLSAAEFRGLQRSLQLQASYWTGVWASRSRPVRELLLQVPIQEALREIERVIKGRQDRYTVEGGELGESFEGSSLELRAAWFELGYKSGDYSS
ncbi:MAG: neutral zinc metallopeptidase, partial [Planctomycetaceae bacterium]